MEIGLALRFPARVRGPASYPAGAQWELRVSIDGTVKVQRKIQAARTLDLSDVAVNVSQLSGTHAVELELRLVSA